MAVKICRDSLLYTSANEKNFNILCLAILGCMCKQISINYNYDTVIALIYIGDLLSVVQISVSHLSIYLSINISIYYLIDLS